MKCSRYIMEPGLASYTRKIVISPYVGGEGDYVISHIFKLAQIQVKMIQLYLALLLHWRSQGVWRGTPSPSVRHWHKILEKPYILAFFSGKENQHTPPLDHTAKGKLDPPLFFSTIRIDLFKPLNPLPTTRGSVSKRRCENFTCRPNTGQPLVIHIDR